MILITFDLNTFHIKPHFVNTCTETAAVTVFLFYFIHYNLVKINLVEKPILLLFISGSEAHVAI